MFAFVVAGSVQSTGGVPATWRLVDGRWVSGFDLMPGLWQAEGWLPLTENRPALNPATQDYGPPAFTVAATTVTADYPVIARAPTAVNNDTMRTALSATVAVGSPARTAMATNAAYVALGAPTGAQTAAQVLALSQQMNAVIPRLLQLMRLVLGDLSANS